MNVFQRRPWHSFAAGSMPRDSRDDLFRNLVESGADGILVVCLGGTIRFANPAASELLGRGGDELIGQPFGIPIVPGKTTEIDIPRGDGEVVVAEMRSARTSWRGQPSYLASLRDVTERKKADERLRDEDRRKDEFLAMLAHELRNPLAAIGNAVTIATKTQSESDRQWSQQVISHQCQHLSRLVDDLLDVSRITRGKIELRRVVLDAVASLRQAVETVRPLIRERDHVLEVDLPSTGMWIEADPTRFEQVFVNLLTNAAKYTPPGGTIRLRADSIGNEHVISIQDDGIGMPPESIPQMFALFAQGERSLARSEGGLGIGLTLVRALVELHGGMIQAQSDGPGRGSEFVVQMPSAQDPSAGKSEIGHQPHRMTHAVRILVVDDLYPAAEGMAKIMEMHGHVVATAYNGVDAIETARTFRPQVVLLDIGLPGMDGYEVAARLRADNSLDPCLIIAISGYGQDADRQRSQRAGMDHHLLKPVDLATLVDLVAKHGEALQS